MNFAQAVRSTSSTCSIAVSWIWRSAPFPNKANDFRACRCCKMISLLYCARVTRQQAPANCRWNILLHYRILQFHQPRFATDFVDQALARRRLTRRIQLRAPFLSAVRILVASDMVSILDDASPRSWFVTVRS